MKKREKRRKKSINKDKLYHLKFAKSNMTPNEKAHFRAYCYMEMIISNIHNDIQYTYVILILLIMEISYLILCIFVVLFYFIPNNCEDRDCDLQKVIEKIKILKKEKELKEKKERLKKEKERLKKEKELKEKKEKEEER